MAFIEQDFPVEYLNRVALSEGNAKKPVYRMHKWWARRLGSVFRSIILSTFGSDEETAQGLWNKFSNGVDLRDKVILDPFHGGGTTVVEALRLGCKVIGIDINPVAWFITKKEVEPVDLKALDAAFDKLEQTAGERIKEYYSTTDPDGYPAEVMYFFWVKVAECAHCGHSVRLFPNYELSRRDHVYVCACPHCLQIVQTSRYNSTTTCPDCGKMFDPRKGVSSRGTFECPECHETTKLLDAVTRKGGTLDMELYALEGYSEHSGRFFKRVDDNDLARLQRVKDEFKVRKADLVFPRQAIPTQGRSDPRPVNHGYTHFWQMFNERQLICLSILLEEIIKIPDQNIRELMTLAFSDSLNTNNMFCKYEVEWHKISLFFSLHAFHPIERPAENNVWGAKFGRGTFVKCFEKVRKGKLYCQMPHERLFNSAGKRYSHYTKNEQIEGQLVKEFDQIKTTQHGVLLKCQSSENLSFIPDKSVDAIITDPPYFDNVQYAELADFFYVWLRLVLKDTYSWFEPDLSSRPAEIVKNDKLGKTTEFFNQGLRQVFSECHRVLKDDSLLVFTFHHNKTWAWEGLGKLLLEAGFYVAATPIVRSEGKGEVHSSEGNIRYDCIFVCRKQPSPDFYKDWPNIKERLVRDALDWVQRTQRSGMRLSKADIYTIFMAKAVEHCSKALASDRVAINLGLADALKDVEVTVKAIAIEPEPEQLKLPSF